MGWIGLGRVGFIMVVHAKKPRALVRHYEDKNVSRGAGKLPVVVFAIWVATPG